MRFAFQRTRSGDQRQRQFIAEAHGANRYCGIGLLIQGSNTPASLLLIVVFIGANLLLWRLYRKDYTAEFSWWKHLAFPILGSAVLLLPLIAQFYPAPPHPLNLLPIFAGAWIVIGILILVTGGQRVQAASGAFLDSQSASALVAPEEPAMNSLDVDLRGLVGKRHALDLTHPLANGDPIFPGQQGFSFDVLGTLDNPDLPLYYGCISFMEHCGTHMDSPAHVVAGARYLDELTPPELIAPAVKLDLRAACGQRSDYDVSEADIAAFEAANGPIALGSLVFLHTGWDARYHDPDAFIVASDDGGFHWPGLSRDAAALLAARNVRGVGIDTIGMESQF